MRTKPLNPHSMEVIMENFRHFEKDIIKQVGEHDNKVYLFEENQKVPTTISIDQLLDEYNSGKLTEEKLIETWERSFDYEAQEVERLYQEHLLFEQPEEEGAETVEAPSWIRKLGQLFNKALDQAIAWLTAIKDSLKPLATLLTKVFNLAKKFCSAHPLICKIVLAILVMLAIAGVIALISNQFETISSVDPADFPICEGLLREVCVDSELGGYVIDESGINAMKGFLRLGYEEHLGESEAVTQSYVEAFEWLEQAHASKNVVDLSAAATDGNLRVQSLWKLVKEYATTDDPVAGGTGTQALNYLARLGEKVYVQTETMTTTVSSYGRGGMGTETTTIIWKSLAEAP